ncbi:CDP-alcohol phosphatidyltransferase family protein [Roseovarius sp. 2305UL8-3]|uniref:CDP-alcohol phosphatidyltransferase family protein n=1 Tax=Roseovarius conchicola TaxID=3121636 RepID=UPI0035277CE9
MTDRRPIASRETGWANALTRRLAARDVSPNQISIASMVFAALAGLAFFVGAGGQGVGRVILLVLAALFCQLRLICNLLDGMVAMEAGKGAPDGPFWNEVPDRVSDLLIFVGLGYGLGLPELGWAAAALAIGAAYVRELGRASTGENDFCGPMAKPHRMALITGVAVLACFEGFWGGTPAILPVALWVVAIGTLATIVRRSIRMIAHMKKGA